MALPDFVVIGAPHAGTSSLHTALASHPGLAMSSTEDPGFFLAPGQRPPSDAGNTADPVGPESPQASGEPLTSTGPADPTREEPVVWCRSDYEALFPAGAGQRPRGESTPYYLADFPAQRRMHEVLPYLRLVAVLRDPVERAYANWLAQRRAGQEQLPNLPEALAAEEARKAAGWARRWRYAEHSRYGSQLHRLYTLFAPSQVLLVRYRDLVEEPTAVLRAVCAFVRPADPTVAVRGGDRLFVPAVPGPGGEWVGQHATAADPMALMLAALRPHLIPGPPPPPGLRARVLDHFIDDIVLLAEVTGRSFDEWLDREDRPQPAQR